MAETYPPVVSVQLAPSQLARQFDRRERHGAAGIALPSQDGQPAEFHPAFESVGEGMASQGATLLGAVVESGQNGAILYDAQAVVVPPGRVPRIFAAARRLLYARSASARERLHASEPKARLDIFPLPIEEDGEWRWLGTAAETIENGAPDALSLAERARNGMIGVVGGLAVAGRMIHPAGLGVREYAARYACIVGLSTLAASGAGFVADSVGATKAEHAAQYASDDGDKYSARNNHAVAAQRYGEAVTDDLKSSQQSAAALRLYPLMVAGGVVGVSGLLVRSRQLGV